MVLYARVGVEGERNVDHTGEDSACFFLLLGLGGCGGDFDFVV